MTNIERRLKHMTCGMVLASMPLIGGCGDNILTWTEDVELLDGRVITVTQKNRVDEVPREFWLTIRLPEFSEKEIVWHEGLRPYVLNIYQGNLYVVGIPGTSREYNQYGRPEPTYVGYRYDSNYWVRIQFSEIPVAIYDFNMYPNTGVAKLRRLQHVSIADKAEIFKEHRRDASDRRIDPNYKSSFGNSPAPNYSTGK